jgi:hypothetical protein
MVALAWPAEFVVVLAVVGTERGPAPWPGVAVHVTVVLAMGLPLESVTSTTMGAKVCVVNPGHTGHTICPLPETMLTVCAGAIPINKKSTGTKATAKDLIIGFLLTFTKR